MFKKIFSTGPFSTFYFVFAYIIAFSLWWAYLLYAKNETAYSEKIELRRLTFEKLNPGFDYNTTDDYLEIHGKYNRQRFMIITEGGVFILLLVVGLYRVRKVFLHELELAAQQRNFLLSITHELKSPLSTVKLSLQTMTRHKLEQEKADKLINNSLVDLDRLESLVDNILFAAKIEREEPGLSHEEIDISEIVRAVTDRFAQNKKAIKIEAQIPGEIYLNADTLGFTSVVINLIENAIKYSAENTKITVALNEDADKVYLQIADGGTGISEADKKKVFNKFYRVGNEDTRNTKGTGLGLYIVKRVVEIYNGTITIENNKPQGSIFKLQFPKTFQ